jgi:hypothetical protein
MFFKASFWPLWLKAVNKINKIPGYILIFHKRPKLPCSWLWLLQDTFYCYVDPTALFVPPKLWEALCETNQDSHKSRQERPFAKHLRKLCESDSSLTPSNIVSSFRLHDCPPYKENNKQNGELMRLMYRYGVWCLYCRGVFLLICVVSSPLTVRLLCSQVC